MSRKEIVEMLRKAGYSERAIKNIMEFYASETERKRKKGKP